MLKIVVFDSSYGGESFADYLEEQIQTVEVIRVIDWRNADSYLKGPKQARKKALAALEPYIGRADLIVIANYFLTATSLKFLQRKYKTQKFIGLCLTHPGTFNRERTLILTQKSLARTVNFYNYRLRLRRKVDVLYVDDWISLIDDGELTVSMIKQAVYKKFTQDDYRPNEIILTCSALSDIRPLLKSAFGYKVATHDSFKDTVSQIYRVTRLRGYVAKGS